MNDKERAPVTAVFSPQGGSGCSFLACHLAFQHAQGRHLLMDLDTPCGGLDLMLDVTPQKSWEDLLPVLHELNGPLLERAGTPVLDRGDLLAGAPHLQHRAGITDVSLRAILQAARSHYQSVVLDLPHTWSETVHTALLEADSIALVLRLDLPGLYLTQRTLERFDLWRVRHKVRLIGMETAHPKALHRGEIESVLGPLWATLPWAPEDVTKAINLGDPLRLHHRPLQDAFEQVTGRWRDGEPVPPPKRSRQSMRFRMKWVSAPEGS